jgi:hypothetical protein
LENPGSIKYLLRNQEARALFTDFISFIMKTPRAISFLGLIKYLHYRTPVNLDRPWGWKDPRNTYTLPLWLDIFPDAKVIHICRHGVDVVNSLMMRRKRGLFRLKDRHPSLKRLYWLYLMLKFVPKPRLFVDLRCDSLEEGLSMWEEYIEEARAHLNGLKDRAIEVKYEDLLAEPARLLRSISDFCGLRATDKDIQMVASKVKPDRAYAYRGDPELEAFTARVALRLRAHGY